MSDNEQTPQRLDEEEIISSENNFTENELEKLGENDPDEAVHLKPQPLTDENKEHDPDDAVHKGAITTIISEDIEKPTDVDDLIHGH